MIYERNITGTEAKFICDFRWFDFAHHRFSIFESKSELPNPAGINRRTDGITAGRARRTARHPLRTCTTVLLSELLCVKSPFFSSENKKTAQPVRSFNGDWNRWRPGRNDLLVSNPELNCPIAITNMTVLSTIGPDLSRIFRTILYDNRRKCA